MLPDTIWIREFIYVFSVKTTTYFLLVWVKISNHTRLVVVADAFVSVLFLGIYMSLKYGIRISGGVPLDFIFDIFEKSFVAIGLILFLKIKDEQK